ncbi:protein late bloomer [Scaptodrosophila lebanonensis]|uniref:Tetraspanin n=1 Tax=Drosophila lebanonensis TaxID=7225 RepID=A0A6J2UJT7_DROLE|nr:protein late bloomer [Scaptodrosophila lebanonensis]
MGCATATIKYLVFVFNALCAILGIAVIVVSSLALRDTPDEAVPIIVFFIVIGSIVFLISFFGCCGAIKKNVCLTWTYAIILLVVIILTCVLTFVYLQRIDEQDVAQKQVNKAWELQKNGSSTEMAFFQSTLKCCGIDGPANYTKANMTIPESCYATNNTTTHIPYQSGCVNKLVDLYVGALHWVKISSMVSIGVEGIAFLCASILAVTFNNEQRRSRY